jgi:1-deoxy-D-xylulose-5-phosphate reductoisomerase
MGNSVKRLAILGSTGSIGQQTLDIVRTFPDRFSVLALAAGNNLNLLARQVEEFKPSVVSHQGKQSIPSQGIQSIQPEDIARLDEVDIVVIALSGDAGLKPTLAAIHAGKRIALANKESLVAAGEIIITDAKKYGAYIMPVDSEHSAIWQCLTGEISRPERLILTASGGPFLHFSPSELSRVTPEQALNHPSWKMGRKVTVDSATLMNKGLEIIEAHWLFDTPLEKITVLVHPQSIVHSMVEFVDGAIKAQLGYPDMRLPIQYALLYPERLSNPGLPGLDVKNMKELTFEEPDFNTFPCLRLAIEAGRKGGTYPAVLSASDEIAVNLFLTRRIGFDNIARIVEQVLTEHKSISRPRLEEILAAADWAKEKTRQIAIGDNL